MLPVGLLPHREYSPKRRIARWAVSTLSWWQRRIKFDWHVRLTIVKLCLIKDKSDILTLPIENFNCSFFSLKSCLPFFLLSCLPNYLPKCLPTFLIACLPYYLPSNLSDPMLIGLSDPFLPGLSDPVLPGLTDPVLTGLPSFVITGLYLTLF